MQGHPLKQLLLTLLLVALLVPVILRLTGGAQPATPQQVDKGRQQGELTPVTIRLQFAHPPELVLLKDRATPLWTIEGEGTTSQFELQRSLDLTEGLLELPVEVRWPEGTPETALTLSIEPEGMEAREVTLWGSATLNEFIELHWDD